MGIHARTGGALLGCLLILVACGSEGGAVENDDVVATTVPATTPTSLATTTSTAPTTTTVTDAESALATVQNYLTAFNRGDIDTAVAFLPPGDGTHAVRTRPDGTPFEATGHPDTIENLAWSMASGNRMTDPECKVEEVSSAEPPHVTCELEFIEIARDAAGLVPLGAVLKANVSGDTFVDFDLLVVLQPDAANGPYLEWMSTAHPEDVEAAAKARWGSVDDAIASGRARASHIDEWAAYVAEKAGRRDSFGRRASVVGSGSRDTRDTRFHRRRMPAIPRSGRCWAVVVGAAIQAGSVVVGFETHRP